MTTMRAAYIIDETKLGEVVAVPAPVEGVVDVLVWVVGLIHWVQIVGKLGKVMQPPISLQRIKDSVEAHCLLFALWAVQRAQSREPRQFVLVPENHFAGRKGEAVNESRTGMLNDC